MNDLTVVIPVYKEHQDVVQGVYFRMASLGCHVIIVNDGSTVSLGPEINALEYYPHMGYGYALKKGIEAAKTPFVCTMDGDGQHRPEDVENLYKTFKNLRESGIDIKMLVGSRHNLEEKMIRRYGRKVLNFIATLSSNHYLQDLNSGLRMFERDLAVKYFPIVCDEFSFTTSLTMSIVTDNHLMGYLPIQVKDRPFGKSHVRVMKHGLITLYYILKIGFALRTRKIRAWIRSFFTASPSM